MPMDPSLGDINIRLSSQDEGSLLKPLPDTPFRMAVMGDFTGRMNRNVAASLQDRRPVRIDRDDYETVLARLSPELQLVFEAAGDAAVHIRIGELDDFHPDRLLETLPVFQELRQTLKDLDDPRRFEHAAARIRGWAGPAAPRRAAEDAGPETVKPPENALPAEAGEDGSPGILDRIIDEAQGDTRMPAPIAGRSDWDRFLNRIAAPHRVTAEDPRQAALKTAVSEMIAGSMQRILHHPDFQRLESIWRGVWQLVSDLETDELLSVYLMDVSKAELAADLAGSGDDADTDVYRLLVREAVGMPGAVPWAVAAGCYTFGSPEDVAVLARMARISAMAGAPFLSGADSRFIGCASIVETPDPDDWSPEAGAQDALQALRKQPEAAYIGLALPRFLLRVPYGKETDPVDRFDFEEMGETPAHEDYLWGDAALFCIRLLGRSFARDGWDFRPGRHLEIQGLPLHVYRDDGIAVAKPCAEVLLTERAALRIMDKGIMPLLSIKNQDGVRLGRFQSLADPPTRLAGRWEAHE